MSYTVELGYNVKPKKLCRYKRVSLNARRMMKVTEKHFNTKFRPADILLVCLCLCLCYNLFYYKLQLKFRNNKNYSSVTLNLYTSLRYKHINFQLQFKKRTKTNTKNLFYSRSFCSKRFWFRFPTSFGSQHLRDHIQNTYPLFLPFSVSRNNLTFSSALKTFLCS